jgi:hypothetical protein
MSTVNDFMKKIQLIKSRYEDDLMSLRYSLLETPGERRTVLELLNIMNKASDEVIGCMELANTTDKPEVRKKCMEIMEDYLPEYFYFLEDERNILRNRVHDPPPSRDSASPIDNTEF